MCASSHSPTPPLMACGNEDDDDGTPDLATAESPATTLLFSIPNELFDIVSLGLSYTDLKALRETCRAATGKISSEDIHNARIELKDQLFAAETADYNQRQPKIRNFTIWARRFPNEYRTYWSSDTISNIHKNYITKATRLNCYACLTNLPRECFTDRQATGSRCLGHKDAKKRFCIQCGVKRDFWDSGLVLMVEHKPYVVCKMCHTFQKGLPWHRKVGVCSDRCPVLLEQAEPTAVEERSAPAANPEDTRSLSEFNVITSTRATRCLRCWGIDHTERLADGEMGLCKPCRAVKLKESVANALVAGRRS